MQVSQEKVAELIGRVTKEVERNRNMSDADMKNFIQTMVHNDVLREQYLSINEQYELINQIYNSIKKLGVLQPLLDDKGITEIMINGPSDIFIERDGRLMRVEETFADKTELEDIVQRIVSRVNREVTAASPICDARLEDGSRINIVLDPIALNGPIVTIRKFPEKVINFQDLISWGAISAEAAEFLEACVRAKYNIFVSGGTGSGKTTFLEGFA